MRVVSLGSSSSGNSLFVEAGPRGRTKILIDAGLGVRVLTERLAKVGTHPSQLQGIFLTHEHSDHVLGLPALVKRYRLPIITDARTHQAVQESLSSGAWRNDSGQLLHMMAEGENDIGCISLDMPTVHLAVGGRMAVGDIEVISFPVSHDAAAPCGYLLQAGGCRLGVAIDTGEVTTAMLEAIRHADLLVLEANHDRQRLLRGPYPQTLKQRILSQHGHLSNDQAADAILRTWRSDGVRWLWLAHLSRTNNTSTLALDGVRARLQAAGAPLEQVHLSTLPPGMGGVWDSTQLWSLESMWVMNR